MTRPPSPESAPREPDREIIEREGWNTPAAEYWRDREAAARSENQELRDALRPLVGIIEEYWRGEGWDISPNSGQADTTELVAVNVARALLARLDGESNAR